MPTPTISPPNSTPPTSFGFGPRPSFSANARTSRRRGAHAVARGTRRERDNAAPPGTRGFAMEDEDAGLARRAEGRAARGEAATATTGEAAIASIETGGRRDADVRGWCVPRSRKTAATCTSVFIFDRSRRDAETWPQELEPHLRTDNHRADPMSVATMRASRLGIDATAPSRRLRSRRASASTTALPMPRVPPVTNILDGGSQSRRWTCAALAARRPSGSG